MKVADIITKVNRISYITYCIITVFWISMTKLRIFYYGIDLQNPLISFLLIITLLFSIPIYLLSLNKKLIIRYTFIFLMQAWILFIYIFYGFSGFEYHSPF